MPLAQMLQLCAHKEQLHRAIVFAINQLQPFLHNVGWRLPNAASRCLSGNAPTLGPMATILRSRQFDDPIIPCIPSLRRIVISVQIALRRYLVTTVGEVSNQKNPQPLRIVGVPRQTLSSIRKQTGRYGNYKF